MTFLSLTLKRRPSAAIAAEAYSERSSKTGVLSCKETRLCRFNTAMGFWLTRQETVLGSEAWQISRDRSLGGLGCILKRPKMKVWEMLSDIDTVVGELTKAL
jgi:hypothetical protein